MAEAGLRQNAMRGGAYLLSRQAFSVLLKLLGVWLITRVLGPTEYGSYVAAFSVFSYAMLLGQAGVGVYLLRHPGDVPEAAYRTAYALLLATAVLLTVALEATRPWIADWTDVAGYAPVMAIMALALPFQLLSIPATIRLERALDYRNVAIIEIGGEVSYYALAAPLALSGLGAWSLAAALLVKQALFFVLAHRLAGMRPRIGWDGEIARGIVRYAATFSLANWIWSLRMLVNPMIVGPALGAQAVGIIGLTVGMLEMLSIVKTVAWRLSVSVLSRIQHDAEKLRRAVTEGMELQTLAVGIVLLGFGWVGGAIIPVVFGPRWADMMIYYPFIALAYLTIATFNVHSAVMSVIDRNRDLAISFVAHIVPFAAGTWWAVRQFGTIGYGIGEMLALPAYAIMHLLLARRIGSPDYRLTALWWTAAAVGLFWGYLGIWAIAVPFAALLVPVSLRKLRGYWELVRRRRAPATEAEAA